MASRGNQTVKYRFELDNSQFNKVLTESLNTLIKFKKEAETLDFKVDTNSKKRILTEIEVIKELTKKLNKDLELELKINSGDIKKVRVSDLNKELDRLGDKLKGIDVNPFIQQLSILDNKIEEIGGDISKLPPIKIQLDKQDEQVVEEETRNLFERIVNNLKLSFAEGISGLLANSNIFSRLAGLLRVFLPKINVAVDIDKKSKIKLLADFEQLGVKIPISFTVPSRIRQTVEEVKAVKNLKDELKSVQDEIEGIGKALEFERTKAQPLIDAGELLPSKDLETRLEFLKNRANNILGQIGDIDKKSLEGFANKLENFIPELGVKVNTDNLKVESDDLSVLLKDVETLNKSLARKKRLAIEVDEGQFKRARNEVNELLKTLSDNKLNKFEIKINTRSLTNALNKLNEIQVNLDEIEVNVKVNFDLSSGLEELKRVTDKLYFLKFDIDLSILEEKIKKIKSEIDISDVTKKTTTERLSGEAEKTLINQFGELKNEIGSLINKINELKKTNEGLNFNLKNTTKEQIVSRLINEKNNELTNLSNDALKGIRGLKELNISKKDLALFQKFGEALTKIGDVRTSKEDIEPLRKELKSILGNQGNVETITKIIDPKIIEGLKKDIDDFDSFFSNFLFNIEDNFKVLARSSGRASLQVIEYSNRVDEAFKAINEDVTNVSKLNTDVLFKDLRDLSGLASDSFNNFKNSLDNATKNLNDFIVNINELAKEEIKNTIDTLGKNQLDLVDYQKRLNQAKDELTNLTTIALSRESNVKQTDILKIQAESAKIQAEANKILAEKTVISQTGEGSTPEDKINDLLGKINQSISFTQRETNAIRNLANKISLLARALEEQNADDFSKLSSDLGKDIDDTTETLKKIFDSKYKDTIEDQLKATESLPDKLGALIKTSETSNLTEFSQFLSEKLNKAISFSDSLSKQSNEVLAKINTGQELSVEEVQQLNQNIKEAIGGEQANQFIGLVDELNKSKIQIDVPQDSLIILELRKINETLIRFIDECCGALNAPSATTQSQIGFKTSQAQTGIQSRLNNLGINASNIPTSDINKPIQNLGNLQKIGDSINKGIQKAVEGTKSIGFNLDKIKNDAQKTTQEISKGVNEVVKTATGVDLDLADQEIKIEPTIDINAIENKVKELLLKLKEVNKGVEIPKIEINEDKVNEIKDELLKIGKTPDEITEIIKNFNEDLNQFDFTKIRENFNKLVNEGFDINKISDLTKVVSDNIINSFKKTKIDVSKINLLKTVEKEFEDLRNKLSIVDTSKFTDDQRKALDLLKGDLNDLGDGINKVSNLLVTGLGKFFKNLPQKSLEQYLKVRETIVDLNVLNGRLKELTKTLIEDLKAGNIRSGLNSFKTGVVDLGNQLKATSPRLGSFISGLAGLGPAAAVVGGAIVGIGLIGAKLFELQQKYREAAKESTKFQKDILAVSDATNIVNRTEVVARIKVLADTTGLDPKSISKFTKNIAKGFSDDIKGVKISIDQAQLQLDAFIRGGATEDDLDWIAEYSTQMRGVGFSLQETIELQKRFKAEGIFQDKGLDAIKEAGLRLREFNSTAESAITDVFGGDYANFIKERIKNGVQINEIISEISTKTRVLGPALKQRITADIFGAPGEDAGDALFVVLSEQIKSVESNLLDVTNAVSLNISENIDDGLIRNFEKIKENLKKNGLSKNIIDGLEEDVKKVKLKQKTLAEVRENILGEITKVKDDKKKKELLKSLLPDQIDIDQAVNEFGKFFSDKTLNSLQDTDRQFTFFNKNLANKLKDLPKPFVDRIQNDIRAGVKPIAQIRGEVLNEIAKIGDEAKRKNILKDLFPAINTKNLDNAIVANKKAFDQSINIANEARKRFPTLESISGLDDLALKKLQKNIKNTSSSVDGAIKAVLKSTEGLSKEKRADVLKSIFGDVDPKQLDILVKSFTNIKNLREDEVNNISKSALLSDKLFESQVKYEEALLKTGDRFADLDKRQKILQVTAETGLINFINDTLNPIVAKTQEIFLEIVENSAPLVDAIFSNFKDFSLLFEEPLKVLGESFALIFDLFLSESQQSVTAVSGIQKSLKVLTEIFKILGLVIRAILLPIVLSFRFLRNSMESIRSAIQKFTPFFNQIGKDLTGLFTRVSNLFFLAANFIKRIFGLDVLKFIDAFTDKIGSAVKYIKSIFSSEVDVKVNTKEGQKLTPEQIRQQAEQNATKKLLGDAAERNTKGTPKTEDKGAGEQLKPIEIQIIANTKPFFEAIKAIQEQEKELTQQSIVRIIEYRAETDDIENIKIAEATDLRNFYDTQRKELLAFNADLDKALTEQVNRYQEASLDLENQTRENLRKVVDAFAVNPDLINKQLLEIEKAIQQSTSPIEAASLVAEQRNIIEKELKKTGALKIGSEKFVNDALIQIQKQYNIERNKVDESNREEQLTLKELNDKKRLDLELKYQEDFLKLQKRLAKSIIEENRNIERQLLEESLSLAESITQNFAGTNGIISVGNLFNKQKIEEELNKSLETLDNSLKVFNDSKDKLLEKELKGKPEERLKLIEIPKLENELDSLNAQLAIDSDNQILQKRRDEVLFLIDKLNREVSNAIVNREELDILNNSINDLQKRKLFIINKGNNDILKSDLDYLNKLNEIRVKEIEEERKFVDKKLEQIDKLVNEYASNVTRFENITADYFRNFANVRQGFATTFEVNTIFFNNFIKTINANLQRIPEFLKQNENLKRQIQDTLSEGKRIAEQVDLINKRINAPDTTTKQRILLEKEKAVLLERKSKLIGERVKIDTELAELEGDINEKLKKLSERTKVKFDTEFDIKKLEAEEEKVTKFFEETIDELEKKRAELDKAILEAQTPEELDKLNAERTANDTRLQELKSQYKEELRTIRDALRQKRDLLEKTDDDIIKKGTEKEIKELKERRKKLKKERKQENTELSEEEKERRKLIASAIISAASVIADAIFEGLKAASQANIDAITNVLDKQKERIDNIRQLLEEGGERAKNVSTELLEAEKNRQAELEKLRQQEIEKQQDYMVAQLAIQGSLAIAQAFVQYPFPASIGVAAATALAFFAQIAAIRATAQNQRVTAEKGGLVVEGGLNQRGRLIGNTHRNGGIQIEAESGEYIFSRRHSSEFDDIFNLIHNDKISRRDLVLKNDLFTQQRINDKKIIQNFNNIDLSSLKSELNEIKRVIEIKNYNLNLDGEKINKTISTKNKAKQATKDKASIIKKFKR